ncbi:uncharacterized protein METZ01_LOCUS509767, partial [marine metagenome]
VPHPHPLLFDLFAIILYQISVFLARSQRSEGGLVLDRLLIQGVGVADALNKESGFHNV